MKTPSYAFPPDISELNDFGTHATTFYTNRELDAHGQLFSSFNPSHDLLDLTGKVIIVTGSNTGVGYSTVKHLARKGAKALKALDRLEEENIEPGEVHWLLLDLSDPKATKETAELFRKTETRLDVLELVTLGASTGTHIALSHFSTFLFTQTLLPLLVSTARQPKSDVRIITVSSSGHALGRATDPAIQFRAIDDFNTEFKDDLIPDFSRYSRSKLCNVLYMNILQARLDARSIPITCMSLHPGGLFLKAPDEGAYTSCFAAASPLIKEDPSKYKGQYLCPVGVISPKSQNGQRTDLGEELWDTTMAFFTNLGLLTDDLTPS
ncbi:NAD(P)-binding protein [Hymenopellis radicata]|nr:NAD(P)-binding protein [Hymenopellis radicata]